MDQMVLVEENVFFILFKERISRGQDDFVVDGEAKKGHGLFR